MLQRTACEEAMVARSSKPDDYGEMLSIGDVAAILGVHPDTARRYAREGVIKARKLPNSNRHYVLKSELMEWLKSQPVVSDVGDEPTHSDLSRE